MSYGKGVGRLSPIGDEEMSRVIRDSGGRTLLDVACGRGDRLKYIAERFEDMLLSGVELDAENAEDAKNNAPSADIRQANAEELPFCSGAFDIVICECSLSLFDRPDRALCEMYRVLRPNGTLILSDICIKSDRPDVAEASDGTLVRRLFTSAYTEELVSGAGFGVSHFEDRSAELYAMAAQMIFDGTFCSCVGEATSSLMKRTRAGYGLWLCRKKRNASQFGAVIAAAGLSSRMGSFKPLIDLGGETIIRRCVMNFRNAGIDEIVVITGRDAGLIEKELRDTGVSFVYNESYRDNTMFDSVRLGLRALDGVSTRIFVTPGDVPLVKGDTVARLMASDGDFVRPVCSGRGGHPIVIGAGAASSVISYGGEGGLRGAVSALGLNTVDIETDDEGMTLDADTPEELERIRKYLSSI